MRHRRQSAPLPSEVTGLEPTKEETALCELESGSFGDASTVPGGRRSPEVLPREPITFYSEYPDFSYHIYQEDNVDICSGFLVGQCLQGSRCPKHHTVLPYAWQLRDRHTTQWTNVEEGAHQALERQFSDPHVVQVIGMYKGIQVFIDFSTMDIYNSPEIDRVRRLSTSTDPSFHFHTSYKYFYEESDDKWIEFDKDFMSAIVEGLRNEQDTVTYSNPLFKYYLHLTKMYQLNLQTGTMRRMARRPIFKSTVAMQAELRTFSGEDSSSHCTLSTPHPDMAALFPGSWIITNPKVPYESIPLSYGDREFAHVYTYFHSTMSESQYIILEMSRIQNYFQWEKYKRKRDHMIQQLHECERKQLERHLFHGTEHILVEAICRQNFDPRVSGKNGTIYGQGCYFAKDASYSHRYAKPTSEGYHYMFLAKVLVGRPARGTQALRRPPLIHPDDPSSPLYDSCVSRLYNPDVFVIFDSDQFYPYFLIKYQKTQKMVILA